MSKRRLVSEGEGDSGALNSYLRQLGDIEVPDAGKLQDLCRDFENSAKVLRRAVSRFGFTACEMLMMLERSSIGEADLSELFLPSSFEKGKLPSSQFFIPWRKEVAQAVDDLKKNFEKNGDCAGCRDHLSDVLCRYPVQSGVAEEYFNIICGYVRMLDADFDCDTYFVRKDALADVSADNKQLVSGKLLMKIEELPAELDALCRAAKDFFSMRKQMVEANLRLVVSIANKFRNRGVPFSDLIQEGNLGLMRALERFDFNLGFRFSTYASWWIRHNIFRTIAEQSRVIRLPMHMIKLIQNIRRHEQNFLHLHGREPETHELAKLMELPEARVSAVRKMAMQTISLQSQVGNDENGSILEELIADESVYEPARELARRILYDRFREMLDSLPEREQQIIIMRFGLFGSKVLPLDEISKRLHLTRERVRQLEIKILATLRSPEKLRYIDGCIHPGGF